MEDLVRLLKFLVKKYEVTSEDWEKMIDKNPYRGDKNVCHIIDDSNILKYIYQYREFLDNYETFQKEINELNLKIGNVTRRVKDHNSIQYKLKRYMSEEHANGHVALRKCLNDIMGFRIIFNGDYEFQYLKKIVNDNFDNMRVVPSIHGDYKATHVYFATKNNKRFVWELQMWNKSDEEKNLTSHHKNKQEYIVWENKEGE